MTMNHKKRDTSARLPAAHLGRVPLHLEPCNCLPLSSYKDLQEQVDWAEDEQIVPIQQELVTRLHDTLNVLLPCQAPVSVFLLHIAQWERASIIPQSPPSSQRHRYHAPAGLLEQVMANVNRVMRVDDWVLTQENVGVAIVLPNVDQQGAQRIVERVYRSISLLQAETVIPPLTLDTTILLGIGTYPTAESSMEQLLYHAGLTARRFTLRPALTTHLWDTQTLLNHEDESTHDKGLSGIPFMRLPQAVPHRLKHFIPYPLALEQRCVPVGRDAHCLTVAMVDPTNTENIARLQDATGMTIFPVSCDLEELYTLLAKKW